MLPFTKNLERMGITARVRTVDVAQYEKRMETFDFDMAVVAFGESLSPGNEQREYWGSQAADEPGSRNLIGIKSKVVDELIEELIKAARPGKPRRPHPRARPGLAIRLLRDPALPHLGVPGGVLGQVPAAGRSRPNTRSGSTPGGSIRAPSRSVESKEGRDGKNDAAAVTRCVRTAA